MASPGLLLPPLPDDVSLQILARLPLTSHPSLSLTSKSWLAAFKSSLLYATRRHLNFTRSFLFLFLNLNSSLTFFVMGDGKGLRRLPDVPGNVIGAAFVAVGTRIYVIGGSVGDKPTNSMWVFDCRFNRWELGPEMRVSREFAAAGVVNGKIYVIGGCLVDNWARSVYWAEVFDPVVGNWSKVSSGIEIRDKWMHASAVIDGKVYAMADRGGVVYDVVKEEWSDVGVGLDMGWRGRATVVGGVLYCYDYLGKIQGYSAVEDEWKELRGVDKGLPKFLCGATMADLGGKLCVVWEQKGSEKEMEIMCAEIEVSKDRFGTLNGSVVWSNVILRVPSRSSIVSCFGIGL